MVGPVELAFRLLTALFVIVTPTLLFLGLWRGLEVLRDDEVIERAKREGYVDASASPVDVASSVLSGVSEDATVTCEACGTANLPYASYCRGCLRDLPD